MPKEGLEVGNPLVVEDVVVRPIARRRIATLGGDGAEGLVASLVPVGVIVEEDGTSRALDLDGDELGEDVLAELADG